MKSLIASVTFAGLSSITIPQLLILSQSVLAGFNFEFKSTLAY